MFILCVHHVCDPCTVFVAPYAMLFLCLEIRFSFILYVYIYISLYGCCCCCRSRRDIGACITCASGYAQCDAYYTEAAIMAIKKIK